DPVMENDTLVSPIENAVSAEEQIKRYLRNSECSDIVHIVEVLKQNLLQTSELTLYCIEQNNIEKVLSLPAGKYAMGTILANGYIDMNFNNCFWKNGQLIFFDQEWMVENIPVNYILYRAVKYAYITSEIALSKIVNYLGINE